MTVCVSQQSDDCLRSGSRWLLGAGETVGRHRGLRPPLRRHLRPLLAQRVLPPAECAARRRAAHPRHTAATAATGTAAPTGTAAAAAAGRGVLSRGAVREDGVQGGLEGLLAFVQPGEAVRYLGRVEASLQVGVLQDLGEPRTLLRVTASNVAPGRSLDRCARGVNGVCNGRA